jgi:hypothetical protein
MILLVFLTLNFSGASADDTGPGGFVLAVDVNGAYSDFYKLHRGKVQIRQVSDSAVVEYTWGGTTCSGRDLTESQVARLFDLAAAPYMLLIPRYINGLGGARCLVGFTAFNRKYD